MRERKKKLLLILNADFCSSVHGFEADMYVCTISQAFGITLVTVSKT